MSDLGQGVAAIQEKMSISLLLVTCFPTAP